MRFVRVLIVGLLIALVPSVARAQFGAGGSGIPSIGNGTTSIGTYNPINGEAPQDTIRRCLIAYNSCYLLPGAFQLTGPVTGVFNGARIMGSKMARVLPPTSGATNTGVSYTSTGITMPDTDGAGAGTTASTFVDSNAGFTFVAGDEITVSGAAGAKNNQSFMVISATASVLTVADVMAIDASAGETVVFKSNRVGCFDLSGDNITLSGFTMETSTAPLDMQILVRLTGSNCHITDVKQRILGSPTNRIIGMQVIDNGAVVQNTKIDGCSFTGAALCPTAIWVNFEQQGLANSNFTIENSTFTRDDTSDATIQVDKVIKIRSAQKGCITGNVFEGFGRTGVTCNQVIYDNAEAEGHHLAIVGNHIETCFMASNLGVIDLRGGRFSVVSGNTFGRCNSDGGCVRIGPSEGSITGASISIVGNQAHNIGTTEGASTGSFVVMDTVGGMISNNVFDIVNTRPIAVLSTATDIVVSNNQITSVGNLKTIAAMIAFKATTNLGYICHDNFAFLNANGGVAITALVTYGGTYRALPGPVYTSATIDAGAANTFTDSGSQFATIASTGGQQIFAIGDRVIVSGFTTVALNNNSIYLVTNVAPGTLTVDHATALENTGTPTIAGIAYADPFYEGRIFP